MREATTQEGEVGSCPEAVPEFVTGLQTVGQVKQIVFVGGACGSIHVEYENSDMERARAREHLRLNVYVQCEHGGTVNKLSDLD